MKLADLTTFRIGGEVANFISGDSEEIIIGSVESHKTSEFLIIGGGSNILAGDKNYDGTVLRINNKGCELDYDGCSGGSITVSSGEIWDDFVARTIAEGFSGLETLSGIPGRVGAAPIQNIGAYGQELSNVLARVRTWDRLESVLRTFTFNECQFEYRNSIFKSQPNRYVILDITVQLSKSEWSIPITHLELTKILGLSVAERALAKVVREKVLDIRRGKGMLLSEEDPDTWSAGSFFVNPVVSRDYLKKLPESAPRWDVATNQVKLSSAWLLESAGITKGKDFGGARISTKHVLALTNFDSATSDDVIALARKCREQVYAKFGIQLEPEVILVGLAL